MKRSLLRYLINPFMDLLLPEKCRVCGLPMEPDSGCLCDTCHQKVRYLGDEVCQICGGMARSSQAAGRICGSCLQQPPSWDQARSVVIYDAPVTDLLHRLKYQADTTVLPALASLIDLFPYIEMLNCDLVLPVPLHKRRLQARGHNQSVHIANLFFSGRRQLIAPRLLKRQKITQSQTGLSGRERRRNLRGAFVVADAGAIHNRSVCLVDDVYTTGTTLEECSKILRRAGASKITVLTIARVEKRKI